MSAIPLTPERIESIISLVEKARAAGVFEMSTDGVSFKLHPPARATPAPSGGKPADDTSHRQCACGHMPYDHNSGGCIICGPTSTCLRKPDGVL